ncbi:MAG: ABC transporter permease [Thermomicrobiales bacterium]
MKATALVIGREIVATLATLLVASVVVFGLFAILPGDPAVLLANRGGNMVTPESIAAARRELGLDRPLPVRYAGWLAGVLRGDLSRSWASGAPVRDLLGQRIGPTLLLGSTVLVSGALLSILLGGLAGLHPNGVIDRATRVLSVTGSGFPAFLLCLMTLRFVVLGLGRGQVIADGTVHTLSLPAAVGALSLTAFWVRPFRALVRDALATDWALACRARGASNQRLLIDHALPNALLGFLPLLGLGLAGVLAGSIVIEYVFSWPGLGPFIIDSIKRRDLPVVQGFALISTAFFVISTQLTNRVSWYLDPNRRPPGGAA